MNNSWPRRNHIRLGIGFGVAALAALIVLAPQSEIQALTADKTAPGPAGEATAGADGPAFELSRIPCSPRAPELGDAGRAQFAIEFEPDTYTLAPGGMTILDDVRVAINSKQLSPDRIAAIAHVEAFGDPALERRVTESMAKSVVAYLVKEGDVSTARLFWSACGASDLRVADDPRAVRNRRIEFLNMEWQGQVAD